MTKGNQLYEIIEDSIISTLETDNGIFLPETFTVSLEDQHFQELIKGMTYKSTKAPIPSTAKRIILKIQDFNVTVRCDSDPEPWLPILWSENIH